MRPIPWRIVRFPAAALMMAAAVLKGYELYGPAIREWRGAWIMLAAAEWILAVWILANVWRRAGWTLTVLAYSVFTSVSLFRLLRGDDDCGCFGALAVPPWVTFTLDCVLGVALLRAPPDTEAAAGRRVRGALVALLAIVPVVPAAVLLARYEPGRMLADGSIVGDGRHVAVNVDEWVGRPFPLVAEIETDGLDLRRGRWTLMFHYHACPRCHVAIADLLEDAPTHPDRDLVGRIVLVEVPPHAPPGRDASLREHVHVAHLSADREWLIAVPSVVKLVDGIVRYAEPLSAVRLPPVR